MTSTIRKEIPWQEVSQIIEAKLPSGLFLTTAAEGISPNTMAVGWGGIDFFFGKGFFLAPVRTSRYTYEILQKSGEFTISVPLDDMTAEMTFAGKNSGRDVNKLEGHGLSTAPSQAVSAPIISECGLHLECRVLFTADVTQAHIDEKIYAQYYASRSDGLHTLFFGEILHCYYTK